MRFLLLFKNFGPGKIICKGFFFLLLLVAFDAGAQQVSLTLKEASLESVFSEIKKQTGFNFVYTSEEIKKSKPVTITLRNIPLKEALNQIFQNQPLGFTLEENYIVIHVKPEEPRKNDYEIRGKVVDEKGEGISSASIRLKDTKEGTATDDAGNFLIKSEKENIILQISSVGYENREVLASASRVQSIELKTEYNQLDETVVIAYGTTTRRLNTGSVSKISSEVISQQPVLNPISAIQGRAPGVFVTTLNGLPGGNIKVEIRGRGSVSAGTEPLYIVDGVPYSSTPLNKGFSDFIAVNGEISPLNNINPLDIESIEVLKDADATAIYGSRGANGVILITTKKGRGGKTNFNINVSQGVSKIAVLPQLLNLQQYLQLRREGFVNDNRTPSNNTAPELMLWDTTKFTNWPKYIWGGTANVTNIYSSITGGNLNTTFLLSGYFRREGSILPGNEKYSRVGGLANIEHESSNKKFRIQLSNSFNRDNNNNIVSNTLSLLSLAPNFPLYDQSGNLNWVGTSEHPLAVLNQRSKSLGTSFITNSSVKYSIVRDLHLKIDLGYTLNDLSQILTTPQSAINPAFQPSNSAAFGNNKLETIILEPHVNFIKKFNEHKINILGGASYQKTLRTGSFIKATDYNNESLLESLGAAGRFEYARTIFNDYKYFSSYGRIGYHYKNKYLLNVNFRRDGSSRFGPDKAFGNFYSMALGWIFSDESFLKDQTFLSFGKIKASYGLTGNDQIADYQFLSTYSSGLNYQNISSLSPTIMANSLYSWETNKKLETSIELGFIKNQILTTFTYYLNRSGNQLVNYQLPFQTGFASYQANLPALIENKGFEFELSADIIKTKNLQLSFNGNLTKASNKLLKFPDIESSTYAGTYFVGQDLSVIRGYQFQGVDPATGLPTYVDQNHDGRISQPQDFIIIGKSSPNYFGGVGQLVKYKSISANIFFQFVNQKSRGAEMFPGHRRNQFSTVMDRWQKPGDQTNIPRAASGISGTPGTIGNSRLFFSDAFLYDASYIRMKNFSISYFLPSALINKLKVETIKLHLDGQNLFTLRKRSNLNDPETLQGGIPPLRTIVAGIQFIF